MRRTTIAATAALLAGCATGGSEGCPAALARYTPEEQRAAADALPQAPPILRRMIEDYGELRAQVRAAR